MVAALAPVIGAAGVSALFARSVRLVRDDVAALAVLLGPEKPAPDVRRLASCLDQMPRASSQDTAIAVYATLVALLATFIGDPLTQQLVKAAFPALGNTSPKETT